MSDEAVKAAAFLAAVWGMGNGCMLGAFAESPGGVRLIAAVNIIAVLCLTPLAVIL